MRIAPDRIEDAAKELYVRALKDLPPDIKRGFDALAARETGATAKAVLGTMIENIAVAERTGNLLCQDTGIPIYNVTIGRDAEVDGVALKAAIRRGCERATREYPAALVDRAPAHAQERAHVLRHRRAGDPHRLLRRVRGSAHRDDPQGQRLGEQLVAADGDPGRGHRRDQDLRRRLRARRRAARPARRRSSASASAAPRTCAFTSPRSRRRGRSARTAPIPTARRWRTQLSAAVNLLGVGPQGLGGDATAFAVHVELAATHITMNPVAVNMQCHSARRASAVLTADGSRVRVLTGARACSSDISAWRSRRRRSRRGRRSARWCWPRCWSTASGRCSCCSAGRRSRSCPASPP